MNDPTGAIVALPAPAARMLAVEILLADPEALADDVLESCLYILREKLRAATGPDNANAVEKADGVVREILDLDDPGVRPRSR